MITISEHTIIEENINKPIIIDFGACEGTFLKGCLEKFNVSKYIAVEANPGLFTNLKLLNSEKVNIIHAAVVPEKNQQEHLTFYVDPESIFNSSMLWSNPTWIPHEVPTISLQAIIKKFNLSKIDIFKIDVEGAEWDILDEFTPELYEKVDQITVEFHDFIKPEYRQKTKKIVEKLKALGYRHIYKGIKYMHNSIYYDSLFYKSEKPQTLFEKLIEKIKPVKYY